jgi:hypothetical protein
MNTWVTLAQKVVTYPRGIGVSSVASDHFREMPTHWIAYFLASVACVFGAVAAPLVGIASDQTALPLGM